MKVTNTCENLYFFTFKTRPEMQQYVPLTEQENFSSVLLNLPDVVSQCAGVTPGCRK